METQFYSHPLLPPFLKLVVKSVKCLNGCAANHVNAEWCRRLMSTSNHSFGESHLTYAVRICSACGHVHFFLRVSRFCRKRKAFALSSVWLWSQIPTMPQSSLDGSPKEQNLAMRFGRAGHTLSALSITETLANHRCLWGYVCGRE